MDCDLEDNATYFHNAYYHRALKEPLARMAATFMDPLVHQWYRTYDELANQTIINDFTGHAVRARQFAIDCPDYSLIQWQGGPPTQTSVETSPDDDNGFYYRFHLTAAPGQLFLLTRFCDIDGPTIDEFCIFNNNLF